jgi:aspartate/methionine/tyrosine aminotransferase
MELAPHALDQWLQSHAEPPLEFDLGASTGPHWTVRELLRLGSSDALERLLDTELTYSRMAGATALRAAIAEMQGVAPDHVLVMAGAAEALWHVFMIAAEPGANAVVPFPCFPPHRTMPQALGFEVRPYHLRRDAGFRIDLDEIMRLVDAKTKILLVNLPNNPTGAASSDAEMRSLHDLCADRGVQFVCDEVHHPIYHGSETGSGSRWPRTTSIGDFSKAFSLAGLRLGWIIDADAHRRQQYLNAREYVTISNTPMAELLAQIAVEHRETLWGRTREVAGTNLRLLDEVMARHRDLLQWVRPQGGMTGFPWLVAQSGARPFCEAAIRHGLLLVPGDCFGFPAHFRIGFGVSREWFPRAMARFHDFLEAWRRGEQG